MSSLYALVCLFSSERSDKLSCHGVRDRAIIHPFLRLNVYAVKNELILPNETSNSPVARSTKQLIQSIDTCNRDSVVESIGFDERHAARVSVQG